MFRSGQIIIRDLCCSLLKLYYNIQNLIRFCKQGVVADMLPQHLVCKNELNFSKEQQRSLMMI